MKRPFFILAFVTFFSEHSFAQVDSTLFRRIKKYTTKILLNMDAIYNRPFLSVSKLPVAVGGYVEANWQHQGTNGVTEGNQFLMRRLTLFLGSSIYKKIKFLSEIEFEDGTKEINIEFASVDFELHPLLNFRGGVVMNPIGAFNQNHDGPKWEFIDRPISATQMLPATWSNVGFGLYGKKYKKNWVYAYETYLTNGFDDRIISNSQNKTFLPASKLNPNRFEESSNGQPLLTSKIAVKNRKIGELGLSYMGGVFNKFQEDGITLDKKRRVDVWAIDFNTVLPYTKTYVTTEWAMVNVDVPETYTQQYGNKQAGGFIDFVQPILRRSILSYTRSVVNANFRFEYVDWNIGKFRETGTNIREDVVSIMPGLSWRPFSQTVIRLNYRYKWQTDILGNPAAKTSGFQFGFSSYF
jgi:hypothetical protein